MDLTIIIVNYNTKKLTLQCIKSIKASKPKLNYEIVVVDNGSTDPILKSSDYTLLSNTSNLGFAKANNQGIKIAKGEYILLLNSDTIVKGHAIDKLYDFAKTTPYVGVVGPKLLNKDGSVQDSVFHFPAVWNAIKEFWFGKKGFFGLYVPKTETAIEVDAVVGAALMITPAALKQVGNLNEKYFFYYEDLDYCRKVHDAGLKVYYLPSVEITHLKGASGKNISVDNKQWNRLIPSSKIYHGVVGHYILFMVMWLGQKWGRLFK